MMRVLTSGSFLRDMYVRYSTWKSGYDRFRRWTDDDAIEKMLDRLPLRLYKSGYLAWDVWSIDEASMLPLVSTAGTSEVYKKQTK